LVGEFDILERYVRRVAIGVKPPRLLVQSARGIGVRMFVEEKDGIDFRPGLVQQVLARTVQSQRWHNGDSSEQSK